MIGNWPMIGPEAHVNNIAPMVKLISKFLCMMSLLEGTKRVVSAQSLGQYCELFTYKWRLLVPVG